MRVVVHVGPPGIFQIVRTRADIRARDLLSDAFIVVCAVLEQRRTSPAREEGRRGLAVAGILVESGRQL